MSWASRLKEKQQAAASPQPTPATTTSANKDAASGTTAAAPAHTAANTVNASSASVSADAASSSSSPSPSPSSTAQSRTLLNYFFTSLRGHIVTVECADGTQYEGVFHTVEYSKSATATNSSEFVVVLKQCQRQLKDRAARNITPFDEIKRIEFKNIAQMRALNVDASDAAAGGKGKRGKEGFATDTEISNRDLRERELKRWDEDIGSADLNASLTLEEEATHHRSNSSLHSPSGQWDQFATFESMTGKLSTFNFDDYTTPLDKDSMFYKQNAHRAERIAHEILHHDNASELNVHVAYDRGLLKEMKDDDELFSTVQRGDASSADAGTKAFGSGYVVPAKRKDKDGPKQPSIGAKDSGKDRDKKSKDRDSAPASTSKGDEKPVTAPSGKSALSVAVPAPSPTAATVHAKSSTAAAAVSKSSPKGVKVEAPTKHPTPAPAPAVAPSASITAPAPTTTLAAATSVTAAQKTGARPAVDTNAPETLVPAVAESATASAVAAGAPVTATTAVQSATTATESSASNSDSQVKAAPVKSKLKASAKEFVPSAFGFGANTATAPVGAVPTNMNPALASPPISLPLSLPMGGMQVFDSLSNNSMASNFPPQPFTGGHPGFMNPGLMFPQPGLSGFPMSAPSGNPNMLSNPGMMPLAGMGSSPHAGFYNPQQGFLPQPLGSPGNPAMGFAPFPGQPNFVTMGNAPMPFYGQQPQQPFRQP